MSLQQAEQATPSSSCAVVQNPLVMAGLVPQHLSDIFLTPQSDAANQKSRRITGAKVLTENEYFEFVKEKERKEREATELKQKRREERELKRDEKEKEVQRKKRLREEKQQKGNSRERIGKGKARPKRLCMEPEEELDEEEDLSNGEEGNPHPSRQGSRYIKPPCRYVCEEDSDTDSSNTLCIICGLRNPPVSASTVFWVDCDCCGEWAHTHCALGSNTSSRNFMCASCVAKN